LMAIGLVAVVVLLDRTPSPRQATPLGAPLRALRHPGLLGLALTALFYNFGFFTLLAFTPFPLGLGAHGLGYVFFGWGLMVAVFSVFVAPALARRFGTLRSLYAAFALVALDLVWMGFETSSQRALIAAVIVAGAFLGIVNTLLTQTVMWVAPGDRGTTSAAYSFVR